MSETLVHDAVKKMIATAKDAAAGANTPEDAYKRFMAAAGKGMMQVMADALHAAVSGTVSSLSHNKDIVGWEKFVKGCAVTFDFGSPINVDALIASATPLPIDFEKVLVTKLAGHVTPTPPKPGGTPLLGGGIDIGISGHWSF